MGRDYCDNEVYKKGHSLGFFTLTKDEAESYCRKLTEETGHKHDWHYLAGRVHIKALTNRSAE